MYLSVQKLFNSKKYIGNFKNVEPTETRWSVNGVDHIKYGFIQSGGRFERENISYKFEIKNSHSGNGDTKQLQLVLGTIDWFAMNTPGEIYQGLLKKVKIDQIKETFHPSDKELEDIIITINTEIDKCIQIFKNDYHNSEEYKISKQNKNRIERWMKAKIRFDKEYGTYYFEEIYNFDLELMNIDLLEQVRQQKGQSDGYRHKQSENSGSSHYEERNESSSGNNDYSLYSEEETVYLRKFYKTLAKNYHPDICHDDGKAMQFLNKLREHWNL
jgi:hypothetical protein